MIKHKLLVFLLVEIVVYGLLSFNSKSNIYSSRNLYKAIDLNNDINSSLLENYVIGVVAAEMPATFSFEALKAQSVAARTFSYKKIIDGSISINDLKKDKGQEYISVDELRNKWGNDFDKYYEKVKDAVLSTKGEVILYNELPINSYYFSTSNGVTENSKSVFKEEPYLVSVDSSWDKDTKEYTKSIKIDIEEFKNKLGISDSNINIGNIVRSNTNHVEYISIGSNTYTGVDFRKKLNLRSTDFDISINGSDVEITTRGYGHDVGMSQNGANYLANNGKDYKEIIKYYYSGVEIKKMNV